MIIQADNFQKKLCSIGMHRREILWQYKGIRGNTLSTHPDKAVTCMFTLHCKFCNLQLSGPKYYKTLLFFNKRGRWMPSDLLKIEEEATEFLDKQL